MQNPNEIKKLITPFFKSGVLKYKNSGHVLTICDRYYRCSNNCKGECKNKEEKQVRKEDLKRNFCRLAKDFGIDEINAKIMRKAVMKQLLLMLIKDTEEENYFEDDLADKTLTVIKQEVEKGTGMTKDDQMTFAKAFVRQQVKDYPVVLFGFLGGVVMAFSQPEKEIEIGRALSWISKEIFLSDDGKIESLRFEKWGWYILNFIDNKIPYYIHKIKEKGIKILNAKDEITSLDLSSAIDYMQNEIILPEYQNKESQVIYAYTKTLKNLVERVTSGSDEEMLKESVALFDKMQNDPIMGMAIRVAQSQKAKLS